MRPLALCHADDFLGAMLLPQPMPRRAPRLSRAILLAFTFAAGRAIFHHYSYFSLEIAT